MKDFVPQTREAAVSEYVRVAREYFRVGTPLYRQTARKCLAKAKRIQKASDWRAEMFTPMS